MEDEFEPLSPPPLIQGRRQLDGIPMHLALLIGLCLLLTWPLLIHGIPDLSDDGYHHARWAKQFSTQFWAGEPFPKWFTNVNAGFGGPSGFFCPPLANYASSLFWPFLERRDPDGLFAAGYSVVLGMILSAITAYFWLLSFGNARAALLGSMVYVIAPYHLAVDVYMRGASSEFWVLVWLPLVLLSAQQLIRHSKWALPGTASSFALAVLSHPTTSLCFALIPVSFVFFFSEKKERIRNTAAISAALLVGVGLSAVYILPAILDQGKAHTEWYRVGHFDYHNEWLVQDGKELSELVQFASGAHLSNVPGIAYFPMKTRMLEVTISALLAILFLFWVIRRCEPATLQRRMALFWIVIALLFFFLMNRVSSFVWSLVGFLKFLQFPFRLNIVLVLCVAVLVPLAYPHLRQRRARLLTGFLCLMLMVWLAADLYSSRFNFSTTGLASRYKAEMFRPSMRTRLDSPEMWPKPGNIPALSDAKLFDWLTVTHPPQAVQLEAISHQTSGTATVKSWQPRRVVLKIDALRRTVLKANHFYYAGWRGRIEGTNGELAAYPSAEGLLQVDIPEGRYSLDLELPEDGAERTGIMISLISLLLVLGGVTWAILSRHLTSVALSTDIRSGRVLVQNRQPATVPHGS